MLRARARARARVCVCVCLGVHSCYFCDQIQCECGARSNPSVYDTHFSLTVYVSHLLDYRPPQIRGEQEPMYVFTFLIVPLCLLDRTAVGCQVLRTSAWARS